MRVTLIDIPGVLLIEPQVSRDARGFFVETHHQQRYAEAGIAEQFVEYSNVVRGAGLEHAMTLGMVNGGRSRRRPQTKWVDEVTVIAAMTLPQAMAASRNRNE